MPYYIIYFITKNKIILFVSSEPFKQKQLILNPIYYRFCSIVGKLILMLQIVFPLDVSHCHLHEYNSAALVMHFRLWKKHNEQKRRKPQGTTKIFDNMTRTKSGYFLLLFMMNNDILQEPLLCFMRCRHKHQWPESSCQIWLAFWLIWHKCQWAHAFMNCPWCVVVRRWGQRCHHYHWCWLHLWTVLPARGVIIEISYLAHKYTYVPGA